MFTAFDLIIEVNFLGILSRQGPSRFGSNRAVSPVIATVILVAIAVVLAVALSSNAGSLFGAYTKNAQIKLVNATVSNSLNKVTFYFANTGAAADTINSVSIQSVTTTLTATGFLPTPATLPANSVTKITASFAAGTLPAVGIQVAVNIATTAGQSFTISTPVQA